MQPVQLPEHRIETRRVADLVPADYNPRKISPKAMEGLKKSLAEFGAVQPIVVNERTGHIVGGHQRVKALAALGQVETTVIVVDLSLTREKALNVALNNPHISGEFDDGLGDLLDEINGEMPELFADLRLDELLAPVDEPKAGNTDPDDVPEAQPDPVTRAGDVWVMGEHRLICGDSTVARDVAALIPVGTRAALLHADPPYGMGKEADGVENDNLYAERLDQFQMAWWRVWRPFLADNASAYIWGTAEDLWRLWYAGGLAKSERLTFRNEVVWDKVNGMGMSSETHRQFATATERCLFFMLGEQGFNTNADNYFEGWEPVVSYLEGERQRAGWSIKDTKRIAGHSEKSGCHWFDKSQWMMPTRETYDAWKEAAKGVAFQREYDEIKREWLATRAFFDNVHDNMRDVWNFDRVEGADRHGHATPKPVAMIVRAIKSSCPDGGVVLEPFNGSGTTLIAAETCGRVCYASELTPTYVDTTVRRWQAFTGKTATLDGDGRTFAEIAAERATA